MSKGMTALGLGLSRSTADGLYIKRFVGSVLAGDTYLGNNPSGTEVVLSNPNGPVMGGIPSSYLYSQFSEANDGGRFGQRVKIVRAGSSSGAQLQGYSALGTLAAPTASQNGNNLLTVTGIGFGATVARVAASIVIVARENFTDSASGGALDIRSVPVGTATAITTHRLQSAAGTGEFLSIQATYRFIPSSTGVIQIRNRTNTANVIETGADDIGFYGVARVARQLVPLGSTTDTVINALNALGLVRLV